MTGRQHLRALAAGLNVVMAYITANIALKTDDMWLALLGIASSGLCASGAIVQIIKLRAVTPGDTKEPK